jgi:beta-lactamase regulating signal transducer with metallopeptidase domain
MNYVAELLGWVVFQVAWQTLVLALLLLFSLRSLRGAPATQRYRCGVLHLFGALGAVALSLIVSHVSVAATASLAAGHHLRASRLLGMHSQAKPFLQAMGWIWLAGILIAQGVLALRFLRLRRFMRGAAPASVELAAMVEEMSLRSSLSCPPVVLCADIFSPMVAGRRPPFLLVPRAFSERHPPAEMRALLAHELAHILRHDYSRNVLQLFAVSLLWWHPGAWLMYARIRHERECASDEHAVRLTGSAASLGNALFRMADAPMATESAGVTANSSGLLDRIRRISELHRRPARDRITLLLASAFAALAIMTVTASSTASHAEALTREYAASTFGPATVFTIRAQDPAGTFLVKMVRGHVVAIELEQKPVPFDQVVQRGDTVRVVGHAGQELLLLEVDPRGGLRWSPRRSS